MQQPGGGPGRHPGRSPASSSASPSSSSSAPSHQAFEQQQQQQQQQLAFRQAQQQQQHQQQQLLRKSEGEGTLLAFQGGGMHGAIGGSHFASSSGATALPQFPRKFGDVPHQISAPQHREDNQNKRQGVEQHMQNPLHQAYLQFALQAAQQKPQGNPLVQQQSKIPMGGPPGREVDVHGSSFKMQDLMSLQAANQLQFNAFKRSIDQMGHGEKQMEPGSSSADQRNELKPPQVSIGQFTAPNIPRPVQSLQSQTNMQNFASAQLQMAQLQALQAWAQEKNIDLSHPSSANLLSQLMPMWHQSRVAAMQKASEASSAAQPSSLPSSKQHAMTSPVGSESSAHANSLSDHSGQGGATKSQQTLPSGTIPSVVPSTAASSNNSQMQQQLLANTRGNQNERPGRHLAAAGNGVRPVMHIQQSSGNMSQSVEHAHPKNTFAGPETLQAQHFRSVQQPNRLLSQPAITSSEVAGIQVSHEGGPPRVPRRVMFTGEQLHVLKAQILAFRRIKRGEHTLPPEVLEAIVPPPLDSHIQHTFTSTATANQVVRDVEEQGRQRETSEKAPCVASSSRDYTLPKEEPFAGEENAGVARQMQGVAGSAKEKDLVRAESVGKVEQTSSSLVKSEQEVEKGSQTAKVDYNVDKGKAIPTQEASGDAGQVKKLNPTNSAPKDVTTRKYHGPLFDFPFFARKHDSLGSSVSNNSSLTLAYDVKDLLCEEGAVVLNKKKTQNLKKLTGLLAVNLERKRIRPDLVLRLQIEEKKLRLLDLQARLRDEVDQEQQEIMAMSDRPYRKFVRQCERQRQELIRQVQHTQKLAREKQLRSIFQWRKKLLEAHWAIRDARTTRNRGVAKYHERMLREFSKRKDDDRNKRMEALKNNDVDRYREMLLEQQTNIPGDAAQRYSVLSSFLSQTEEYLYKLGGKITAAKNHQEVQDAANAAAAAARAQGLSEEEVRAAASCAGEEVMIRKRFSEMNAPKESSSVNKYYNLAHAVNERVVRQPSMLRAGTLREYQLVGLQWMLSLYNNKLNGILADEMGLGKTVQVMALIAYLMEFKGNYGPHLIIVPNAVLVNWKSELHNWLPSVSCIFYVGSKDQRSKLFTQEVCAMKFNVLVTTYEFVMYDRSKLSKIDWKYIIIDEAQRMKDRESVLARDLDRYRCQRRLLLTGTPLQNDLKELWSLLNLLLPEVFDNRKAFHDWFSKPFQKDGPSHSPEEDDWLETEKKVIIIHRLHQILEPFMLRRRVEDVEGSLPRKVSIVLRCRMSALQSAIYDWIKSTGTIRVDPEDEMRKAEKNPLYQVKVFKNLNNKCMELRKVCNHPLLNYPYFNDYSKDFIVRSCGKLWILDRILMKLERAGHRVLLFSTMTKLLDILEEYLQWRRLVYRRIDGTTSLEDRESAIVDFNSPDSDCFIFLLSIRAAGRGLNLQTADTVVIYDPDPNPQNEEQAVARAHRIGQQREVKVIYMEAVVDKISSYQKEDDLRNGGTGDLDDDLAGRDRYMGSIESLIRNNIQQYKIDMADEVINAGRFDQRTTHEERRMTLETLLHDDERYQETVHDIPSMQEVNRMIARSEEEVELFDQMDDDLDWVEEMTKYNQVPKWLRAGSKDVNAIIASLSKKPLKNILAGNIELEPSEIVPELTPSKPEKRRGRPRGLSSGKKHPVYRDFEEDGEDFDASSEERNAYSLHDEEGEQREFEDEVNGTSDMLPNNKEQSEEDAVCDAGDYEFSGAAEGSRSIHMFEEAGSSGSSSGSRKLLQASTPSVSSQKFGSLSALDARPGPHSKRVQDDLEEGEIAVSGDSHMDLQQSGSWNHERDDNEEEQVLQPTIKRKRSIRIRPRHAVERSDEKCSNDRAFFHQGSQLPIQGEQDCHMQLRLDPELDTYDDTGPDRHDLNASSVKQKRSLSSRKASHISAGKPGRLACIDAPDQSRGSWNGKAMGSGGSSFSVTKMSDITQRKCKNVISKLQRRIDKEGHQIAPILSDWWKRNVNTAFPSAVALSGDLLDLKRIDQRVDNLEYNGVMEFIEDVQLMLKNVVRYCSSSFEARYEARKLHEIFFEIMKIAFPDSDFREARNAVSFSSSGAAAAAPSSRQGPGQSKLQKQNKEVEPEAGHSRTAPRTAFPVEEDGRTRGHLSKIQRETEPTSGSVPSLPLLAHPGDLVICKKKRKDRDKPAVQRMGPISPSSSGRTGPQSPLNPGRLGPVSPTGTSRSAGAPSHKDSHPNQPGVHPIGWSHQPMQQQQSSIGGGSPGVNEVQWARPVKRMRSDSGRRRPSHP